MYYRANDLFIGRSLECCGHFSPDECDLFRRIVSSGDTVVEAGANIGCFTIPLAQFVGTSGTVYAFEPADDAFQILESNLALNRIGNVVADNRALGSDPGSRVLPDVDYTQVGNFGDVTLSRTGPGKTIEVTTIDSIGLHQCHLIKADVQGAERDVLLGAAEAIARFRPILYVENDIRSESPMLLSTLQALGYQTYWHLPLLCKCHLRTQSERCAHLINRVSVNLLCVPEDSDYRPDGLRMVADIDDWWQ